MTLFYYALSEKRIGFLPSEVHEIIEKLQIMNLSVKVIELLEEALRSRGKDDLLFNMITKIL